MATPPLASDDPSAEGPPELPSENSVQEDALKHRDIALVVPTQGERKDLVSMSALEEIRARKHGSKSGGSLFGSSITDISSSSKSGSLVGFEVTPLPPRHMPPQAPGSAPKTQSALTRSSTDVDVCEDLDDSSVPRGSPTIVNRSGARVDLDRTSEESGTGSKRSLNRLSVDIGSTASALSDDAVTPSQRDDAILEEMASILEQTSPGAEGPHTPTAREDPLQSSMNSTARSSIARRSNDQLSSASEFEPLPADDDGNWSEDSQLSCRKAGDDISGPVTVDVGKQRKREVSFSVATVLNEAPPAFLTQPIKSLHQAAVQSLNTQKSMRLSGFLKSLSDPNAPESQAADHMSQQWAATAAFKPTVNNPLKASLLFDPNSRGRTAKSVADLDPSLVEKAVELSSEIAIPDDILVYELLGEGGYGNVYSGTWNHQSVAVKHLPFPTSSGDPDIESMPKSFLQEVGNLSKLSHPNLLRILGFFCDQSSAIIVTELIESGCVTDVLALLRDDEFRETICALRVRIAFDVAAGFSYLHNLSPPMIHRDLKSPNILLRRNGQAIIADFGLARFSSSQSMTKQVGTPYWMAPEILLGEDYDTSSDVYSYAIVLYELATGHLPHEEISPMHYLTMMFDDPSYRPVIPDVVPPVWTNIIQMCWAPNGADRPTFDEILYYIDEHQDEMYFNLPPAKTRDNSQHQKPSHSTLLTMSSLSESMSRLATTRLSSHVSLSKLSDIPPSIAEGATSGQVSYSKSELDTRTKQAASDPQSSRSLSHLEAPPSIVASMSHQPRRRRKRRRRKKKDGGCCNGCVIS